VCVLGVSPQKPSPRGDGTDYRHPLIEICNKLLFAIIISMTHSHVFPFLVLNVVNLLFCTYFYWKWPLSCHVFEKLPGGKM